MKLEFEVVGPWALFTDPINRLGGEKASYMVPTEGALAGMCANIYRKPTFTWYVDRVRIMNPIKMESMAMLLPHMNGGQPDMATYLYLRNVRYQVQAHTEWTNHPQYEQDRNPQKHAAILERALARGGRLPVTLGTSECIAEVRACKYGEGIGYYDGKDMDFGIMEHCVLHDSDGYDEATKEAPITVHFWHARMENGEIVFPHPKDCPIRRPLKRKGVL